MKLIEVTQLRTCDPSVQLIEVGAKTALTAHKATAYAAYEAGHIPRAIYVDLAVDFSTPRMAHGQRLDYQCPTRADFIQSMQRHGLSLTEPIVIYDRENHIWAARLAWVLEAFGHANVSILHGGFQAWQAQGYALEEGHTAVTTLEHRPVLDADQLSFRADYFADLAQVKAIAFGQQQGQLLNVLRPEVFSGQELRYFRAGHIPNSINLPFAQCLDAAGRYQHRSPAQWQALGLHLDQPIVVYCGSGITASGAAFALQLAGAQDLKIYDGSMSEWSADPALPLVCS